MSPLEFISQPPTNSAALQLFPEFLRRWFVGRYETATVVQRLAWPLIANGRNVLITSPTGSGKTLAAFLPILSRLISEPEPQGIRCLYVSPLRALCNDMQVNLEAHLREITRFSADGAASPVRVGLRTGDADAGARRRLFENPPALLVTTPETLALLLADPRSNALFAKVKWVIVDEVHGLASNKRGTDLTISLERLTELTHDEPRRIGLSATCAPLTEIASWLVGVGRPVTVAAVPDATPMELRIEHLREEEMAPPATSFMRSLIERLQPYLSEQATTLIFMNMRSLAERLTWALRRRLPAWADRIAVHHSGIGVEARAGIESLLKAGHMRVVVSSTSLELGIDIRGVEQVVMIHPPRGAARLLQRLGRSGHGPGRPRRGVLFTSNMPELLEALATIGAGLSSQLEPLAIPRHPLDVLSQQLVGMAVRQAWTPAKAWSVIRRAYPYRDLSLQDFSDCLEYLSGGSQRMKLPARLRWIDHQFSVLNSRTARIYRMNAGTLNVEETRAVRREDGAPLGSVADFFADHLQAGDRFLLEGRCLEVASTNGQELQVREAAGLPAFTRWQGGFWSAPQALAERLWFLRLRAKETLLEGPARLLRLLEEDYGLDPLSAQALADHLLDQETVSEIPGNGMLVEIAPAPDGEAWLCAFHLPLAMPACEAVGRVVLRRMEVGPRAKVLAVALGFILTLPAEMDLDMTRLREWLSPERFREDLDRAVADSSLVGARFGAAAMTGLMLLRNPLGRRRKVGGRNWAATRLFNWVRFVDPGFPLLRQAMREARAEVFAEAHAVACLHRLQSQPILIRHLPRLSPIVESWLPTVDATVSLERTLQDLRLAWQAKWGDETRTTEVELLGITST